MGRILKSASTRCSHAGTDAKQFARIGKESRSPEEGRTGPDSNPPAALHPDARAVNMPKDRSSPRSSALGRDAANFEEVLYEATPRTAVAYCRVRTDNPTRTVASVRNAFSKNGGNLATPQRFIPVQAHGVFRLNPEGIDQDDLELY